MNAPQLPQHLQGRVATGMASRASEGLGSTLPPHLSIQGNKFTFIDSAGGESNPMLMFDGYIVDVGDFTHKRFYDRPWDPNANTYEPPACWSSNGIGPSREASRPQAMTCESCEFNVRGSAFSNMTGAAIKKCRDEKWISIVYPQFGEAVWQMVITPGSFKNWKSFTAGLDHYQIEPYWVLTRFAFEDKKNGVLTFSIAPAGPQGGIAYTPPEHLTVIDRIIASKVSDAIVGRLDQPRTAALPNYSQGNAQGGTASTLPPNQFVQAQGGQTQQPQTGFQQPQGHQEVIPPGQAPFGQPQGQTGGFQTAQGGAPGVAPNGSFGGSATGGNAATASPSNQAAAPHVQPQQRRRRNAAAQATPAQAGPGPAPQGQQVGFQAAPAPVAPFGQPASGFAPTAGASQVPAGAPQQAGSPQNNFGIAEGAPVDPAMSAMLNNLFQQGQGR